MDGVTFSKLKKYTIKTLGKDSWIKVKPRREFVFEIQRMVDDFVTKSRSENVAQNLREYLRSLYRFTEFTKLEPKELIDEQEADEKRTRRRRTNPASIRLADFERQLKSEGNSHNTIVVRIAHLKTFYRANGFPIRGYKAPQIRKTRTEPLMNREKAIEAIESAESLKVRALVHLLWSSGLSISDAVRITKAELTIVEDWGVVSTYRKKTEKFFRTIVTPDCLDSLKRFWKIRGNENETLLGYDSNSAQQALRRLSEKMGEKFSAHDFRRAFFTTINAAGLDSLLAKYMLGHKLGVESHYMEFTPEQIVEAVKPYYPALRLTKFTPNNHIQELEGEIADLKEQVSKLTSIVEQVRPILREQGLVLATRRPKAKKRPTKKQKRTTKKKG